MEKKLDVRKYCVHAVGVDQKGLLSHNGGFTLDSNCDTMDIIPLNYCPYCGLKLRKERPDEFKRPRHPSGE